MRILTISDAIPPEHLGGSGRMAVDTAMALAKAGYESVLLTAASVQPEIDGVTVRAIPRLGQRWAHWRSIFSAKREQEILWQIEQIQPDIIHAHAIAWQFGYRWIEAASKRGIRVIVTAHDVMNVAYGRVRPDEKGLILRDLLRHRWSWNPLRNSRIRSILNRHATVLCVSDALREFMELQGLKNLRTVHNGIDLDFWKEELSQTEARKKMGLPLNVPLFLLAGRLGVDKGTHIVDAHLPSDAHLIIAGSADLSTFHHIASDRLKFFPNQTPERMRLLYCACDAVLVPSLCLDCFPTVCLEAMACSRPVLASSWGGAKESVRDDETGWIIDPLNEKAWADRMQWCCEHRLNLPDIGKQARKRMEESFSLDIYLKALEHTYHQAHTDRKNT